ncbi:hypothetical protein BG842_07435 [Haladaptatus sp. W1]|nr:hypothetical protein BG842_26500 [Haladaptatus sp. W1]ODR79267.1 hypothetical protein BG842_07435 [Haladaptatus sp. W1]
MIELMKAPSMVKMMVRDEERIHICRVRRIELFFHIWTDIEHDSSVVCFYSESWPPPLLTGFTVCAIA